MICCFFGVRPFNVWSVITVESNWWLLYTNLIRKRFIGSFFSHKRSNRRSEKSIKHLIKQFSDFNRSENSLEFPKTSVKVEGLCFLLIREKKQTVNQESAKSRSATVRICLFPIIMGWEAAVIKGSFYRGSPEASTGVCCLCDRKVRVSMILWLKIQSSKVTGNSRRSGSTRPLSVDGNFASQLLKRHTGLESAGLVSVSPMHW